MIARAILTASAGSRGGDRPDHPNATAGADFQLPYRASFLLRHRRSAWLRFAERLDELAAFAAGLHPPDGDDVAAAVSGALSRTASDRWLTSTRCDAARLGPATDEVVDSAVGTPSGLVPNIAGPRIYEMGEPTRWQYR
jgi:hypothetical protein